MIKPHGPVKFDDLSGATSDCLWDILINNCLITFWVLYYLSKVFGIFTFFFTKVTDFVVDISVYFYNNYTIVVLFKVKN